jgi:hypothetical protein
VTGAVAMSKKPTPLPAETVAVLGTTATDGCGDGRRRRVGGESYLESFRPGQATALQVDPSNHGRAAGRAHLWLQGLIVQRRRPQRELARGSVCWIT